VEHEGGERLMEKPVVYGILGGLIGVLLTLLLTNYSINNRNYSMMRMMGMGRGVDMMMDEDECRMAEKEKPAGMMDMDEMALSLEELKGEEFDKRFIELMIEHHKGAIDMARLVLTNTQRAELRSLADDIISAQSKEIGMMEDWNRKWFGK